MKNRIMSGIAGEALFINNPLNKEETVIIHAFSYQLATQRVGVFEGQKNKFDYLVTLEVSDVMSKLLAYLDLMSKALRFLLTHSHTGILYTSTYKSCLQPQHQLSCNSIWFWLNYRASSFRWEWSGPKGVMYPGQVIRSSVYSGPLGTHRTGATLFSGIIVHKGFPWIKCYRLQTQGSQRTHSCSDGRRRRSHTVSH